MGVNWGTRLVSHPLILFSRCVQLPDRSSATEFYDIADFIDHATGKLCSRESCFKYLLL